MEHINLSVWRNKQINNDFYNVDLILESSFFAKRDNYYPILSFILFSIIVPVEISDSSTKIFRYCSGQVE